MKTLTTTAGIAIAATITTATATAHADTTTTDCRADGPQTCLPGNPQHTAPGWYGDPDCWPGAIYCPDIAGPYNPAQIHPGMLKPHTWIGGDSGPNWYTGPPVDLGPTILPATPWLENADGVTYLCAYVDPAALRVRCSSLGPMPDWAK
jgi:hypothetical protein